MELYSYVTEPLELNKAKEIKEELIRCEIPFFETDVYDKIVLSGVFIGDDTNIGDLDLFEALIDVKHTWVNIYNPIENNFK